MSGEELQDEVEQWIAAGCPEPTAAETIDDGKCKYAGCDQAADYRVQIEDKATTLMCDDCSRSNGIWVRENDLLETEMTVDD